jgi:RNA polymerase sigma factor (sigma-70 family)
MKTRWDGVTGWLHGLQLEADPRSDPQLLEAFLTRQDERAFACLVRRHGPMVLAVCRRLLGDVHDAEDAFQATFLVLVRKGHALARRERLAGWLYGVAHRTARKARFLRARCRAVEGTSRLTALAAAPAQPPEPEGIDQEILALPAKYRLPLVLCLLEGVSRRAAAVRLGVAEGTLSSRLARGRHLLRQRLSRRGVPLSVALAVGSAIPGQATPSPALVAATTLAAASFTAGGSFSAGTVPASVLTLAQGVLRTMLVSKLKFGALALSALAALPALAVVVGVGTTAAPQRAAQAADSPPQAVSWKEAVATVNDTPITREELADYLIQRYGAEKLPLLVNQRIIRDACDRKGLTVTPQEIEAALNADLAALKVSREQFIGEVLKKYDKTFFEWQEDVLKPRLLMAKLVRGRITVSEDDLRQLFDSKYGAKVKCKMIVWPAEDEGVARRVRDEIRQDQAAFARAARAQSNPSQAAAGGDLVTISRPGLEGNPVVEAAFRLKPGEVSELLKGSDGRLVVLKCVEHVAPAADRDFAAEKAAMLKEAIERKLEREVPRVFEALRAEAKPRLLLTPPRPAGARE